MFRKVHQMGRDGMTVSTEVLSISFTITEREVGFLPTRATGYFLFILVPVDTTHSLLLHSPILLGYKRAKLKIKSNVSMEMEIKFHLGEIRDNGLDRYMKPQDMMRHDGNVYRLKRHKGGMLDSSLLGIEVFDIESHNGSTFRLSFDLGGALHIS